MQRNSPNKITLLTNCLYLLAHVTIQSHVPQPLIILNYCTFAVLPALFTLHQTHTCSNSNISTTKPMTFALSHICYDWNNLPQDIRHSATLSSYKSKLKTFTLLVLMYYPFLQKETQNISLLKISKYFRKAILSFTCISLYLV